MLKNSYWTLPQSQCSVLPHWDWNLVLTGHSDKPDVINSDLRDDWVQWRATWKLDRHNITTIAIDYYSDVTESVSWTPEQNYYSNQTKSLMVETPQNVLKTGTSMDSRLGEASEGDHHTISKGLLSNSSSSLIKVLNISCFSKLLLILTILKLFYVNSKCIQRIAGGLLPCITFMK